MLTYKEPEDEMLEPDWALQDAMPTIHTPETALAAAVMAQAWFDTASSLDKIRQAAQAWFSSDSTRHQFTFIRLCDLLSLSAAAIRSRLPALEGARHAPRISTSSPTLSPTNSKRTYRMVHGARA